jgi:WD40 repeat protein
VIQPGPFISYARKDQPFVRQLYDALMALERDPWVDWELLPAANWMDDIRSQIDAAPAVVFVLSPDAIASPICAQELGHALAQNKRIIPIVCRDVAADTVPEFVRKLNWIYFLDLNQINEKAKTLVAAMDVDLNWVHAHARLLVRAQEWESKGYDRSLLLRGSDLKESEEWLAFAADRQMPRPTPLQSKYVLASRKAQISRQRYTLTGVTSALLVTTGLAIYALIQSRIATQQRNTAISRMLAAQSTASATGALPHLDLALLQSVAAYRIQQTSEAQQGLFNRLVETNRLKKYIHTSSTLVSQAVSPDGRTVAMGDVHGRITLWDAETLQQKLELEHGEGFVEGLAFSPDGKTLASADVHRVILWDLLTGKKGRTLENNGGGRVTQIAWHPDGATLITNGDGIVFWDVATGEERAAIKPHDDVDLRRLAFSPDGKTIATGGDDSGRVRLWDVATGKPRTILSGHKGGVTALAFSRDGLLLASGGRDGAIVIWDVSKGAQRASLNRHTDYVQSVAFSPDGKTLASGSNNDIIILWNVISGEPAEYLFAYTNGVSGVGFTRDGKELVSHGFNSTFIAWNLETPKYRNLLKGHSERVTALAISPDGATIASGSEDMTVRLWDVVSAQERAVLKGHSDGIEALAFSPQGTLASGAGHTTFIWDVKDGRQLIEIDNDGNVTSLAFSPDGRSIASAVELNRAVGLRDAATGEKQAELVPKQGDDDVDFLDWSRSSKMLVSAGGSTIRFWDPDGRVEMREPIQTATVAAAALSPDSRLLLSSSGFSPPFVILWDLNGGKSLELETGATAGGNAIAFSPDGRTLAHTAGEVRRNIVLWDVAKRKRTAMLETSATTVSMVFTPDGKRLVTGLSNGQIAIWDVDIENWPRRACEIANRNLTIEEWKTFVGSEVPYMQLCPELPVPKE